MARHAAARFPVLHGVEGNARLRLHFADPTRADSGRSVRFIWEAADAIRDRYGASGASATGAAARVVCRVTGAIADTSRWSGHQWCATSMTSRL
jgi:hypothetical protein